MQLEAVVPPPGGDYEVDLPYGKSIFVAGINPDDAVGVLAGDTRFETCDKNEAHTLEFVPDDIRALITMSALLPQDASRLRRNANDRGVRVIGGNWTVNQLSEWKEQVVINGTPAEDNPEPRPAPEPEHHPTPPNSRSRLLDRLMKQRPDITNGRRTHAKQGLPRSIVLAGIRRFDFPEKHRWIFRDERVQIWSTRDININSQLAINSRFVVYDPQELEGKTKAWEKVLSRYQGLQVYEIDGAGEMFEVTRNLIEFGVHPLPASIADSLELEPVLDDVEGLVEAALEEDEDSGDLVPAEIKVVEQEETEPKNSEVEDEELLRKYQMAVQERSELQRQIQTLLAKVKGLEELLAEQDGDS